MPYLWLALAGLTLFMVMARVGPFENKVSLFFVTGSVIAFTDLLVVLFRLYQFRPGLIPAPVPDARLGLFLADGLFVPLLASALVGSFPRRRDLAGLLVLVTVLFVENRFLAGQIFVHFRWKLWYSAVLFLVYLVLTSAWAADFERHRYCVRNRAILTLMSLYYLWTWYSVLTSGVLNLYTLRPHLLPDPVLDNVLSGFLLRFLPFGTVGFVWVWNRWVDRPAYVALLAAILTGWYFLLIAIGIYRLRAPWHPVYAALSATLLVLAVGGLDRWFAGARPRLRSGI